MLYRFNKAHPIIWRDPNTLQIGLGKDSVQLEDLSPSQQQIISALYTGIVSGQETGFDKSIGAKSDETATLIERLSPVLEKEHEAKTELFGPWQQIAFAEIARAGLDYEVNGEMVLAERWLRNIHLDQLDRTGWLLARGLLASGIGTILTHDTGKVLNTDLGELGFPREKLNSPRNIAALEELALLSLPISPKPRVQLLSPKPKRDVKISFAVLVGHLALDPTRYARWNNRDVPHLAIIFGLDETEVSPVVLPGKTGCLNCYQQTKIDEDLSWPVLATQLLDLPRMRDDSSALLASTGLALKLILRYLDVEAGFQLAKETESLSYGYRINNLDGSITRMNFEFHPECSCQKPG